MKDSAECWFGVVGIVDVWVSRIVNVMDGLMILEELCREPTVSYYEARVSAVISRICYGHGLDVKRDRWGNLAVGSAGWESHGGSGVAFVAHMDHPGFEVVGDNGDGTLHAVSHGGMAPAAFESGVSVQIVCANGERVSGRVLGCESKRESPDGRFASSDSVLLECSDDASVLPSLPAPAILDLPDFSVESDMIMARSLDDLAGCATIIAGLIDVLGSGSLNPDFAVVGLFTRAEEVGLVGARLIAEDGWSPKQFVVVSVETSLKSISAPQGSGVVIRVGDRATTFDHDAELLLRSTAERLVSASSVEYESGAGQRFMYQRALMGAGGCEASAFKAHGYAVTGTSYPLGAWHNREEDGSIVAEYISLSDFESGIRLVREVMMGGGEYRDGLELLRQHPEMAGMRLESGD